MTTRRVLALAVGLVALAAGCAKPAAGPASMRGPSGTAAGASSSTPSPTGASAEVPQELRFTAPRLGGGIIRGAAHAGQDLVMWFWAPW